MHRFVFVYMHRYHLFSTVPDAGKSVYTPAKREDARFAQGRYVVTLNSQTRCCLSTSVAYRTRAIF